MKYSDFVEKFKDFKYFKNEDLLLLGETETTLRNQLVAWCRQGKVHRLRRGFYTLNDHDRHVSPSPCLISNLLYSPSYISLETALSFYDLIPEAVFWTTAVTVRKTACYKNHFGTFDYRSLKKAAFFGYDLIREPDGTPILMARPEKAILDKIYFDRAFHLKEDYFLESWRLQGLEDLSKTRLKQYAGRFPSQKVKAAARLLTGLIEKERKHERNSV